MSYRKASGSVLPIVLIMLSVIAFSGQQVLQHMWIATRFTKVMVAQHKARLLAFSGIQIAMAQLSDQTLWPQDPKAEQLSQEKRIEKEQARYLTYLFSHLNRWQELTLEEKTDSLAGTLKLCISCEDGKLNINEAFDTEKGAFKPEFAPLLQGLEIPGKLKQGQLSQSLATFLKKQSMPLDDITVMASCPGLEELDLWYKPPTMEAKAATADKSTPTNRPVALQDIFTVYPTKGLNPLGLSDALCTMLGMRRPQTHDAKERSKQVEQVVKQLKVEHAKDWASNLQLLQPIYEQKMTLSPTITRLFGKEFRPTFFSVLSCAKVDDVEVRALAVIQDQRIASETEQAVKKQQTSPPAKAPEEQKKEQRAFVIVRLYWI